MGAKWVFLIFTDEVAPVFLYCDQIVAVMSEEDSLQQGVSPIHLTGKLHRKKKAELSLPSFRLSDYYPNCSLKPMNHSQILSHVGPATVPLSIHDGAFSDFQEHYFKTNQGEFVVAVKGELATARRPLVRIQSICVHAHIFGSLLCDCSWQMEESKRLIANSSEGVIIFALDHHGKGVGLMNHFRIYTEGQQNGYELVVEAYEKLGFQEDYREYEGAAAILNWFKIDKLQLLTNSPRKLELLAAYALDVKRVPLEAKPNAHNIDELAVKKQKLGHMLSSNSDLLSQHSQKLCHS